MWRYREGRIDKLEHSSCGKLVLGARPHATSRFSLRLRTSTRGLARQSATSPAQPQTRSTGKKMPMRLSDGHKNGLDVHRNADASIGRPDARHDADTYIEQPQKPSRCAHRHLNGQAPLVQLHTDPMSAALARGPSEKRVLLPKARSIPKARPTPKSALYSRWRVHAEQASAVMGTQSTTAIPPTKLCRSSMAR